MYGICQGLLCIVQNYRPVVGLFSVHLFVMIFAQACYYNVGGRCVCNIILDVFVYYVLLAIDL